MTREKVNELIDSIDLLVNSWCKENKINLDEPQNIEPVLQGLIVLSINKFSKSERKNLHFSGQIDEETIEGVNKFDFGFFVRRISKEYKN